MTGLSIEGLRSKHIGPINLHIPSGKCFVISGASGTGKTILLRAIADLDPHTGEISLNGQSHLKVSGSIWRKQVGMLPAHITWWHPNVGDHFNENLKEEWLHALGFSLEVLSWPVSRLSMGESQRLGLIRLLCQSPKVLLLDEPTANLDEHNTRRVEELIGAYKKTNHAVILWVTHQPEQIKRVADQHYAIVQGQLHLQESSS